MTGHMISNNKLIKKFKFSPEGICYIGANEGQELPDMLNCFPRKFIVYQIENNMPA